MNRRGFLKAFVGLAAAPFIPRFGDSARVVSEVVTDDDPILVGAFSTEELTDIMHRVFIPRMVVQIYRTSPLLNALMTNTKELH